MRKLILLLTTLVLVSSCYKDIDNTTSEEIVRPPKVVVDGNVFGTYATASAIPLENVSLHINDRIIEVSDGQIPNIEIEDVLKNGQFLEVFSNDRRVGAAQLALLENEINYINLVLTEPFSRVDFSSGNIMDLSDDVKAEIRNSNFVKVNGDNYVGDVQIEYVVAAESLFTDQLVSFAFEKEGEVVVIEVEKAIYLGFKDEDNEDLSLNAGIINFEVDAVNKDLFYFDPSLGSWTWVSNLLAGVNEEQITRGGWFAIGSYTEASLIEGSINIDEISVTGQVLRISEDNFRKRILTTANGKFLSFVPKDKEMNLDLIDNQSNVMFSTSLISSGIEKADISVPPSSQFILNDFEVLTCDGTLAAEKAISLIYSSGKEMRYSLPSDKLTWFSVEEEDFMIRSGDGPQFHWNSAFSDIHYLSDCASFSEGFTFVKIRNDQKVYPAFTEVRNDQVSTLKSDDELLKLIVETSEVGVLEGDKINISINDLEFGENGYFISCEEAPSGCGIEICEISHFKVDGDDWNRIYFKGKLWMQTIAPPQVGNFQVEGYILSKK